MKDASLIITEKKSVSRAIVEALNPGSFDDRGSCGCEHNEIVSIRSDRRVRDPSSYEEGKCVAESNKSSMFQYFCSKDCASGCEFYAEHIDSQSKAHYLSSKKRLGFQNKGKDEQNKIIFEDIGYYSFDRGGETVIVADTSGNPLSLKMNTRGKGSLEQLFRETEDWGEIEKRSSYDAGVDWFGRKSSEVRARLFNHILAKRKLPDGTPINLNRVIAATDYDIAGSHIFYSIINKANEFVKLRNNPGKNMRKITPNMIYRMRMQSVDPESLIKEFEEPLEFDYQNAAAGELRSMMDFTVGATLTSNLNYDIRTNNPGTKCKVSIGRNRFLGLEELIKAEDRLGEEKEQVYLVFDGNQDLESIKGSLSRKDFLCMQVKSKKNRVTPSDYLIALKNSNIGTHTTRHNIPSQLARSRVASFSDAELMTTPFGRAYYDIMLPHLRGSEFDIGMWNGFMHSAMKELEGGEGIEKHKKDLRGFMQFFQNNFRNYLTGMHSNWRGISREIIDSFDNLGGESSVGRERVLVNEEEIRTGLELTGRDKCLSEDQIKLFMNASLNRPFGGSAYVSRSIPAKEISLEDPIRRVCCIDRSWDFEIVAGYASGIADLNKGNCMVFSAEANEANGLNKFLSNMNNISSVEGIKFDDIENENFLEAHDPLEIKDISTGNISGEKGFELVEEFNAPWIHTYNNLRMAQEGKVDVESFKTNIGKFNRVSRYEVGKAHNYESLLIAMFEKYKMPFRKTANLAEDLYLGK
jgi:hypothetical protein